MKKCLFYLFIVIVCLFFVGCTPSYEKLVSENVSEQRESLFSGKNEYAECTFMGGKREEPYETNGVSCELVDFGIVTLTMQESLDSEITKIPYELTLNNKIITGVLEKSPFEQLVFASDTGLNVKAETKISIFYVVNKVGRTINLSYKMIDWKVDCASALKMGSEELRGFISSYISGNKLNAEIYVKIASDSSGVLKPYYWLVQVVGSDLKTSQVVIDPYNKEVLVKTNIL